MSAETVKKFATQLAERGLEKGSGYNNPYHPEDDLVNIFHEVVDKEKVNYENKMKRQRPPVTTEKEPVDPLDVENDMFMDGNEVLSEDLLTENEHGKLSGLHEKKNNQKTIEIELPTSPPLKPAKPSRPSKPSKLMSLKHSKPTKIVHKGPDHNSRPHHILEPDHDSIPNRYLIPTHNSGPDHYSRPDHSRLNHNSRPGQTRPDHHLELDQHFERDHNFGRDHIPAPYHSSGPDHSSLPGRHLAPYYSSEPFHGSAVLHQEKPLSREGISFPPRRPIQISGSGQLFKSNNETTVKTDEVKLIDYASGTNHVLTRKDSSQIYQDDRADYKPVQRRFVLKSSTNQTDNTTILFN
ncbi:unnamed protein product [Chrysodeixis includens]|uniref:Uncharacterized protein n=1 Tax=Chrysodeixis includens TaxID=689277 RepID=A0A9N8L166_CHRIL|nr:unnamed protein product [Chrysodeixis includens]